MKVLAHTQEQFSLILGSYGRPRRTLELKEAGLDVGERRVGGLMRISGIKPVRTRKHESAHSTFGLGIHHCAGSSLARAELDQAVDLWLSLDQ